MLSKEVESKLGGRYISKEILPYSFKEFLRAYSINEKSYSTKDITTINKFLNDYFINGGLPESINFKNKRKYIECLPKSTL